MARILDDVTKALIHIIENARQEIILISPYIKLNKLLKEALQKHRNNKEFKLVVVYGKNEDDKRLSLSEDDFSFFKTFKNVEVRYHPKLHAKMYANEFEVLITSMNLHDYSMKENIEVGIYLEMNLLSDIGNFFTSNIINSLEAQAKKFRKKVVEESVIEFRKQIKTETYLFGLMKSYSEPFIETEIKRTGFCIRTGSPIPYNPHHPYCNDAYISWSKWKNDHYTEKYCHGCRKSYESSKSRPLCIECYWQLTPKILN